MTDHTSDVCVNISQAEGLSWSKIPGSLWISNAATMHTLTAADIVMSLSHWDSAGTCNPQVRLWLATGNIQPQWQRGCCITV